MILEGNCLDTMKTLEADSVDQLVTDPPYGINFMGKSWDNFEKGQELREDINKEHTEAGRNLYEKEDGTHDINATYSANCPQYKFEGMIEFFVPIWKEAYRVMKPGAFGFVCCIPRQDCLSRMMVSLEMAGFNINFSSIYWTYASGFPKATNIAKKIDKRMGKEREVVGKTNHSSYN